MLKVEIKGQLKSKISLDTSKNLVMNLKVVKKRSKSVPDRPKAYLASLLHKAQVKCNHETLFES